MKVKKSRRHTTHLSNPYGIESTPQHEDDDDVEFEDATPQLQDSHNEQVQSIDQQQQQGAEQTALRKALSKRKEKILKRKILKKKAEASLAGFFPALSDAMEFSPFVNLSESFLSDDREKKFEDLRNVDALVSRHHLETKILKEKTKDMRQQK